MPLSQLQTLLYQGPGDFPQEVGHPSSLKKAVVYLNPKALVHPNEPPVSDLIYSGFLEHLGRCIYGGIVDNVKAPSPKELLIEQDHGEGITKGRAGWRKDVMDVIGKKGELEIPVLRWPGGGLVRMKPRISLADPVSSGNFVSNYHWQDAIGPIQNRPRRIELAWLSDESNQ